MTIGELAARFGLATHVLRHWEEMGLLSPARRANGRRVYDESHVTTVAVIRIGKDSGLSLEQIRTLLARPGSRRAVLDEHRAALRARIAALRASLELLDHAAECPAEDFRTCPDFTAKVDAYVSSPPAGRTPAAPAFG
ncbi:MULTISPECIES: MerR family transcriptional regulator [Actinokineospora]|uniref:MerR family transcriptional regulator n=1 Tax=Actinokineospora fastidiosa TaxID=1816 RepID=A0A918GEY1_9PSEU|nr:MULTISPECIES: MerR family transcriptional regulator [Actinokineospora]UVS79862.1 Copper export regulator [Actinokineospora sp. UTMC 2448]GGS31358.1 MerR family transcriptional regulator [Actinokineospora fastidiosa]